MPTFHYSLHGRFANDFRSAANIDVMIWTGDTLNFYGVRGEEEHVGLTPFEAEMIQQRLKYLGSPLYV